MSLALSAILTQVEGECGFYPSSTYFGSSNTGALQCAYLANAAAATLKRHAWQYLRTQATIAVTAATSYALPADFWCYVPDTMFKTGNAYGVILPTTEPVWAAIRSTSGSGVVYNCRFFQDKLQVVNPKNGDVLNYEYISRYAIAATGAPTTPVKERFTLDTDKWLLDDELIIRDIKWRLKKERGFDDWQSDREDFQLYFNSLKGLQSGAITIIDNQSSNYIPNEPYTNLIV